MGLTLQALFLQRKSAAKYTVCCKATLLLRVVLLNKKRKFILFSHPGKQLTIEMKHHNSKVANAFQAVMTLPVKFKSKKNFIREIPANG